MDERTNGQRKYEKKLKFDFFLQGCICAALNVNKISAGIEQSFEWTK